MIKRLLSPLLFAALALWILFGVCHALGFRDDVSVLSGTVPAGRGGASWAPGVVYVLAWLAAVVAAPILAIAAVLRAAFLTWMERRTRA